MPLTNEDKENIYSDLLLAVTSPLFVDICNALFIDAGNSKQRLHQEEKPDRKMEITKKFLSENAKKFTKHLEINECRNILNLAEGHFKERIKGQDELLHMLLIALILNEHALLEGLPGVGKTEIVKWIAYVTGLPSSRVQFIPDMLPSDLIGKDRVVLERILPGEQGIKDNNVRGAVEWVNGPIFSSLVLADEINRAPSKVQAALLEAMGENQVTPFGKSARPIYSNIHAATLKIWQETYRGKGLFDMPSIPFKRRDLAQFTVFATMNPIEIEGTYPLSEAQIDRFCFKIAVPYPDRNHYKEISEIILKQKRQIDAIEGKLPIEKYEEFFNSNKEFMIPILAPTYFFLRCRSYIIPVFMGEQLLKGETLYERFHEKEEILNSLYDIVMMTNAKTVSTEFSGSRLSQYDTEQINIRRFIEDLKDKKDKKEDERHKKLREALKLPHCQYVLAGASPRGLASLEKAALCESFLKGSESLETRHILAVIKSVLQHRIHMDVHARLAEVTSLDVINNVCNVMQEEDRC
ncbi:MAG TPA: AAA family ATPase [Candidatus Brocadiia bacterium]|nr:AAA family ATPase [Candidatus Brocadiales bacterium]